MNTVYFKNLVAANVYKTGTMPGLPNMYIGVSSTEPDENGGNVTEPSVSVGGNRVLLNGIGAPVNGVCVNESSISMNESTGEWPQIKYYVVFDTETVGTGNLLFYDEIENPKTVDPETLVTFKPGTLTLSVVNVTA